MANSQNREKRRRWIGAVILIAALAAAAFGLTAALQTLVSEFQRLGGRATMDLCEASTQLPANVSLALFRIAQEALQNATKHAAGAQVDVSLDEMEDEVVLTVKDSGPGFNIEDVKGNTGLGLLSMRERARLINGTLLIQRRPGGGTLLTVSVPIGRPGV